MQEVFGLLSGILPLAGAFPYVRDILRHKTKPHRGSFAIWTVLGGIAFFSQLAGGATWSLGLVTADTIAALMIFLLSIFYGMGGLTKLETVSLFAAATGLLLWYFTKQPTMALIITVCVDAIGSFLTVIKTYAEPHTETFSAWLLASLGGAAAAFAVQHVSFNLLLYPVYILVANGAVAAIILLRRPKTPTLEPEL